MKASRTVSVITTIVVLAIFVAYFLLNSSKFQPLLDVNFLLLLVIAIGDMTAIFVNGLFTKFILRPFQKHIPVLESYYVSLISSVGNFFAPAGAGFGFRAVYLKRKFNVPYNEYISTLYGNYIIVFLVNSFAGLLALYLLRAHRDPQYGVLVAIFGIIFVVSLIFSLVKIPVKLVEEQKSGLIRQLLHNIGRVTNGWNKIIAQKQLMLQLICLTLANLLLAVGITWTIIHSLHFQVGFAALLLFSVLGSLSLFINITPANLGIKEAIYLFSSHVLGFSVSQVLSIALVDRGVTFAILLLLWLGLHRYQTPRQDLQAAN